MPALDRLLQAITASDIEELVRVLDDALVAHIDGLVSDARTPPLEARARRYPVVTAENLDAVAAALRSLLEDALAALPDGRVALR